MFTMRDVLTEGLALAQAERVAEAAWNRAAVRRAVAARFREQERAARCVAWWLGRRGDPPRCPAYAPARAR